MPDIEPKYTTAQISKLVKVHRNTLYKWVDLGFVKPPAEKTVYQYKWSEENLQNIQDYCKRRMGS